MKGKKDIRAFQDALLSNTSYIKNDVDQAILAKHPNMGTSGHPVEIDPNVMEKFKALADYQKKPADELVNLALNHFLGLKSLRVEEAMRKKEKL